LTKELFVVVLMLGALVGPATIKSQEKLTKFGFVHLEANGSQAVPFIAKEAKIFAKILR
jgi:hypothetical protein